VTRSGVRQGRVLPPVLLNIIINNVCNKTKEKRKVSDLKAFIYAEDIMIWDERTRDKISPL
jgi:hypothetical protein